MEKKKIRTQLSKPPPQKKNIRCQIPRALKFLLHSPADICKKHFVIGVAADVSHDLQILPLILPYFVNVERKQIMKVNVTCLVKK